MTERRIVMFNQISADGYFCDSNGSLDWIVTDPAIHERAIADMPRTDTILFGRHTYQQFESFWPHALTSGAALHGSQTAAHGMRAMAEWINSSRKLVVTRSLTQATWSPSEIVRELTPTWVRELKRKPGKDVMIFGSGTVVSQLTELGLIDEYRIVVCPVLLGSGTTLFRDVAWGTKLELRSHAGFPSGNLLLIYRRA